MLIAQPSDIDKQSEFNHVSICSASKFGKTTTSMSCYLRL